MEKISSSTLAKFIPLLLMAAAFAVYGPSLGHEFLVNWDDPYYVTNNAAIRGFSAANLKAVFTSVYVGNYAPVQILSYMLDYSLWGLTAAGFIATNIFVHGMNAVLLYALVVRLHGERLWGFLAALLFLVHPLQVESVVWVSQRKNLLAAFFFLAAIHAYLWYRRDEKRRCWWYGGAVLLFSASLLAKSAAVILPVVLLFLDSACHDREGRTARWIDKVPFAVAALAVGVLALVTQDPELGVGGGRSSYPGGGPLATLCTMLPVFVVYLRQLFLPVDLSALYAPQVREGIDGTVLFALFLLCGLAAAGIFFCRRDRRFAFWGSLLLLGFLPVAQIVPLITLMNDRYWYFPMLGAAVLLARPPSLLLCTSTGWRRPLGITLCLLLLPLAVMNVRRAEVWRDAVSLWEDAVRRAPMSLLARNNLTEALFIHAERKRHAGNPDGALALYEQVLAVDPDDQLTLNNAGMLSLEKVDYRRARGYFLRQTERYPQDINGFLNLGVCYALSNEPAKAIAAYERVVALRPGAANALKALGDLYTIIGRPDRAAAYRQAEREAQGL